MPNCPQCHGQPVVKNGQLHIVKVDAILLNLETAVPCGLLINELLNECF
ncbi:MAG: hypothetical protein F6K25_30335 [Okeania sp. SIO2G4]|nr:MULTISPECIES: hypothetical protein [unclassified Okeania]NEP07299.1 hypothetical protein [Okeania sp. SIO4D6]NEP73309.1 hypothetical protein [Okeania sp. SIO2G5]NEP91667.1 hypothetical protein [Okeania sp. SIO2F5]NEQ94702.1 hypothetical protein [Okeania sp. SIO2G4]